MSTFQQQKQQVLQLYQAGIGVAAALKDEEAEKALREAADHLVKGKLFVVVCGEFKQGKSSLVNALIDETSLFPVDIDISTSLVTSITHGEKEKVTILIGEPGQERAKMIEREEVPAYVTEKGNPGNARHARMLMIESPNAKLKDGMVLVDTPGVGSLNVAHTDITYAYLPNADAVLFVSDALKPLTTEELAFVRDKIARHCQNVIFVVTKIDKNADFETVIASNREKLASALNRPPDEVPIVPVSSMLKLAWLKSRDEEDIDDSRFETLETVLWNQLDEQRGQILVSRSVVELGQIVARLKGPIQGEWDALQTSGKEDLARIERQFEESRERLQALMENDAAWRTQLLRGLSQIRLEITNQFQNGFAQVRRHSSELLDDVKLLQNPQQIVGIVETDVNALMSDLASELGQQAADLHARIESTTGMNMNPFESSGLTAEKAELQISERLKEGSWWDSAQIVVRQSMWISAGSTICGLLGGAVGASVGLLFFGVGAIPGATIGSAIGSGLGLLGGTAGAVKKGAAEMKIKNKPEIAKMIAQFIEDTQRLANKALSEAISGMEYAMQDELMNQMRREKKACEQTIRSIQESKKLTQEQAAKRVGEIRGPLQQLGQIQKSAEQLAQSLVRQVISVPRHRKRVAAAAAKAPAPAPKPPASPSPTPPSPAAVSVPPPAKPASPAAPAPKPADTGDWADE